MPGSDTRRSSRNTFAVWVTKCRISARGPKSRLTTQTSSARSPSPWPRASLNAESCSAVPVTARPWRPIGVAACAATPIGRHGLAVTGTAEHDSAFKLALGHGEGERADEVWVVNRLFGPRAEILHFVTQTAKVLRDERLVSEPGMVGSNPDAHRLPHFR